MIKPLTATEQYILECASRREVSANVEARLHGMKLAEMQKILRSLQRRKLIWQSSKQQRNYYGSGFAGYRSL